jgi:hypothetical protein
VPEQQAVTDAAAKPMTEAEWLAAAPESVRRTLARAQAAEQARQTALVSELKDAQSEYSETELKAMSLGDLERLARAFKLDAEADVPDFTGRQFPRAAAAASEDVYRNPPNGYRIALDKKKQAAASA